MGEFVKRLSSAKLELRDWICIIGSLAAIALLGIRLATGG